MCNHSAVIYSSVLCFCAISDVIQIKLSEPSFTKLHTMTFLTSTRAHSKIYCLLQSSQCHFQLCCNIIL